MFYGWEVWNGGRNPFKVFLRLRLLEQALTLTQNITGPVGPETPLEDILVGLHNFHLSYKSFFDITRKTICTKFTNTIYFYLFYIFIYFKSIWGHSWGKLVLKQECPQMFTGPVGPAEVFLTGPKGIFYWNQWFTVSAEPCWGRE